MFAALRCLALAYFILFAFTTVSGQVTLAPVKIDPSTALVDGQAKITGTAQAPDTTNYVDVTVTLCVTTEKPNGLAALCNSAETFATAKADASGRFSATLKNPLKSSTWIYPVEVGTNADGTKTPPVVGRAIQAQSMSVPVTTPSRPMPQQAVTVADQNQSSATPTNPASVVDSAPATVSLADAVPPAVPDPLPDNERVNLDFLAGLLLSQGQQDFSQTNLFLSLNVDETFHKPGWYWQDASSDVCDERHRASIGGKVVCAPRHFPGINGFFQARLTAIPVTSDTATTTTTTTTTNNSSTSYDTFLASRKAAHFEMGLYTPWYFGNVGSFSAKSESFFFAPIVRFGFNTLVDSNASTAPTTASGTAATTTTTQTSQVAVSDANTKVYSFGVGGVRLGTAEMQKGSPRTVHYLDVGFGKFTNLRDLYCSASQVQSGVNSCIDAVTKIVNPSLEYHDTPWRVLVEGSMDIDGFILGFSVNKSFSWRGATRPTDLDANHPTITRAADDVRFLFGYKFDAEKLMSLIGIVKPKT